MSYDISSKGKYHTLLLLSYRRTMDLLTGKKKLAAVAGVSNL
jgi:hypothetical protein